MICLVTRNFSLFFCSRIHHIPGISATQASIYRKYTSAEPHAPILVFMRRVRVAGELVDFRGREISRYFHLPRSQPGRIARRMFLLGFVRPGDVHPWLGRELAWACASREWERPKWRFFRVFFFWMFSHTRSASTARASLRASSHCARIPCVHSSAGHAYFRIRGSASSCIGA
jgi:hypothetical protein